MTLTCKLVMLQTFAGHWLAPLCIGWSKRLTLEKYHRQNLAIGSLKRDCGWSLKVCYAESPRWEHSQDWSIFMYVKSIGNCCWHVKLSRVYLWIVRICWRLPCKPYLLLCTPTYSLCVSNSGTWNVWTQKPNLAAVGYLNLRLASWWK